MPSEEIVWTGRPAQIINAKVFAVCALFCWLVVPLFIALWHWLQVRCTEYTLMPERLKVRTGVLNKTTSTMELYRVKDITVSEPLVLRLFSRADVHLDTTDKSHPQYTLRAIADADSLVPELRRLVEYGRHGRSREIDLV